MTFSWLQIGILCLFTVFWWLIYYLEKRGREKYPPGSKPFSWQRWKEEQMLYGDD